MKVLPGQVFGSLYVICIWTEYRRKKPEKRTIALCWCREFLTYGIVQASNLLQGNSTSGKRFLYKKLPDEVVVDQDLIDVLRSHSWRYVNGYLRNVSGKYMHTFVYQFVTGLNVPDDMMVDHINRNPRDNRICNLRLATRRQNGLNADKGFLKKMFSSSQYKGVYFSKRSEKWCSAFWDGCSLYHVGTFNSEIEAYSARRKYIEESVSPEDKPFIVL